MAFIKAFKNAISDSFANQWLEYLAPPSTMGATTLIARAVKKTTDNGTSNTKGNDNIISDGSKILVPEGTCLITVENGGITGVIAEPGGYTYTAQDSPEAKSIFAGDGFFASTFGQSWNQFKYGGQPGNQQLAFYVNLKEIVGLPFGTQSPIQYEDAKYDMNMFEVVSSGSYGISVIDPVLLFKNFIPIDIASGQGASQLDFGDEDENAKETQMFNEFIGCFGDAITKYSNSTGGSINAIKANQSVFAKSLDTVIEQQFNWQSRYGIKITTIAIRDLSWTAESRSMVLKLNEVKMANAGEADLAQRMAQGNNAQAYSQVRMAQGMAQGMQSMGSNPNGGQMNGMDMMGTMMAMNMANNMVGNMNNTQPVQQPNNNQSQPVQPQQQPIAESQPVQSTEETNLQSAQPPVQPSSEPQSTQSDPNPNQQ